MNKARSTRPVQTDIRSGVVVGTIAVQANRARGPSGDCPSFGDASALGLPQPWSRAPSPSRRRESIGANLVLEPGDRGRLRPLGAKYFQRDYLAQAGVPRLEHGPHTALAKFPKDLVLSAK